MAPNTATMDAPNNPDNWSSAWLDAVAFAAGLAVAWWAGWNTGDLVWSLWLSSFVVGYSTIVWMIGQPAVDLAWTAWRERARVGAIPRQIVIFWLLILGGAGFLLAFFTVHFGGFHYGHSVSDQLPADAGTGCRQGGIATTWKSLVATGRFFLRLPGVSRRV
jgi:hypothetical protein